MIFNADSIENSNQASQFLYNSRIISTFVEYLAKYYPAVDLDDVLEYADMTKQEVNDKGHWFSQRQADRFHEIIVEKTGNKNIAKDAGRYTTSSAKIGPIRKFALGMINPANVYLMIGRLSRSMSRGAVISSKKLSSNSVEIVSTPTVGTYEKPYQCQNRLGIIESLSRLFTEEFADVSHPECIHRDDQCCRYIVSWKNTQSYRLRRLCSIFMLSGLTVSLILLLTSKTESLTLFLIPFLFLSLLSFLFTEHLEKKALENIIHDQGDVAEELMDEINAHHSNAVLVQEVGRAISTEMNIERVIEQVLKLIEKYLNFDHGMVLIADDENKTLRFKAGYGYKQEEESELANLVFRLDETDSVEALVQSFKERTPFVACSPSDIRKHFSKKNGSKLVEKMGIESFISVPIVYKDESIGILLVENLRFERQFTQSEMNFLEGIASQTAVSIVNARSFKRIQESEEKYRLLAEHSTDVIWVLDMALNRYTYISPAIKNLLGYNPDELMSPYFEEAFAVMSSEIIMDTVKKALKKNRNGNGELSETWTIALELLRKDGSTVCTEATVSILDNSEEEHPRLLGITRDISDRKKADEEKQRLESQLQQAQKMESIGTLAGGIAHDFNNILGIILGNTEMSIEDIPEDSRARQTLEEVRTASLRARALIKQLLSFSRRADYVRKPIKIIPVMNESLKFLRSSIPKSVEIRSVIPEGTYTILADRTQIHQIMINLCANAFDAMAEDGGRLTVRLLNETIEAGSAGPENRLTPGRYVRLTVEDTGHGMSGETMERVFDPYFTTKEVGKGTGMGLSVVHGIMKASGGYVDIESEKGRGTKFHLWFPAVDQMEEKPQFDVKESVLRGTERILYVDDEASMARMGQMALERLDYKVTTATDPGQALELLKDHPKGFFQLVITDFSMPGMSGRKLAEQIYAFDPDLPVILSTGYTEQYTEEFIGKTNIKKCLEKPFEISKLTNTLRAALDSRKPETAG